MQRSTVRGVENVNEAAGSNVVVSAAFQGFKRADPRFDEAQVDSGEE